jgi:hypothetical protein
VTCVKDQGENQTSRKKNHCPFEGSVHRSFASQLNNPEARKSRSHNYRFNTEPRFLNQELLSIIPLSKRSKGRDRCTEKPSTTKGITST